MRIGILTLHDSVNYGALAQAYALRYTLSAMGHDAFVMDRRRDSAGRALRTPPRFRERCRAFGLFKIDACNCERESSVRVERSLKFLQERVRLTPYSFREWGDAPGDLGLDALVVGSDQVWNANSLDPSVYLLQGAPEGLPAVAYAASIGMPELPAGRIEEYRSGLARFTAIGVRERSAAELVASAGFKAARVADPVLLAGAEPWQGTVAAGTAPRGRVFAYFLAEDLPATIPALGRFAAARGTRVDLFADWFSLGRTKGWRGARRNAARLRGWRDAGVDLRVDAGPEEFVRSLAAAEVVVSNSYHALVFALVFGKEARIVLPTHPVRRAMNSRLLEVAEEFMEGPLVHESLDTALASLSAGERCRARRDRIAAHVGESRRWLADALGKCAK